MADPLQELFDTSLTKHKAGNLKEAAMGYHSLLNRNPYDPRLRYLLGNISLQRGENGMAITLLESALQNAPTETAEDKEVVAGTWNDLGCALKAEHYDEGAALAWEKSIEFGGRQAGTLNNLATLYADSGYPEKALPYIEEALKLDPENPHVHWNKALALLTQGRWAEGWLEHEYRRRVNAKNVAKRTYGEPWNLQKDGMLVIHGEQGLGDEIMFATCIPDALADHPNVVIECEKKLVPLFRRSFGVPCYATEEEVKEHCVPAPGEKVYQIGMGSLPQLYRNQDDQFPERAVLKADPDLVEEARQLVRGCVKPLILTSFLGGTKQTRVQHRSLSARALRDLTHGIGTAVSAQYGKYADVEADDAGLIRFGDWTDGTDLDKLAAMITVSDEIVSVCTTLIHLAGALGKPVQVMTPLRSSWRYGLRSGEGAMVWYRGHTLHRQVTEGDWAPVLKSVRSYLEEKYK